MREANSPLTPISKKTVLPTTLHLTHLDLSPGAEQHAGMAAAASSSGLQQRQYGEGDAWLVPARWRWPRSRGWGRWRDTTGPQRPGGCVVHGIHERSVRG